MENFLIQDLAVNSSRYSYFSRLQQFNITHDYTTTWMIILLFNGSMLFSIEQGGEQRLCAGELLIIPPYYNVDKLALSPLEFGLLRVETSNTARKIPLSCPVMKITDRVKQSAEIMMEMQTNEIYRKVLILDIWYQIATHYAAPQIPNTKEKEAPFEALLTYIEKNYKDKLTLDTLCKISGYSKSALIRDFRIHVGQTPMHYVTDIRITNAKKMLSNNILTLRYIANKCGFANEFYFSTAFKAKTVMTPSEFRKNCI